MDVPTYHFHIGGQWLAKCSLDDISNFTILDCASYTACAESTRRRNHITAGITEDEARVAVAARIMVINAENQKQVEELRTYLDVKTGEPGLYDELVMLRNERLKLPDIIHKNRILEESERNALDRINQLEFEIRRLRNENINLAEENIQLENSKSKIVDAKESTNVNGTSYFSSLNSFEFERLLTSRFALMFIKKLPESQRTRQGVETLEEEFKIELKKCIFDTNKSHN